MLPKNKIPFITEEGKMFILIFSIAFLVVASLAVLVGVLRARKKSWQLSVTKIIISVLSAVLSAFLASLIAKTVVGSVFNTILIGELKEIAADVPSAIPVFTAVICMIVAPFMFLALYFIIRPILAIFTKLLTRLFIKITNKNAANVGKDLGKKEFALEKANGISALCGGICTLISLCILCVPFVGVLEVVDDVASLPLHNAATLDESGTVEVVADVLDGASHNAGTYTVKYLGGGLLYDMMTTYTVGEERVSLRDETGTVKAIANAVITAANENATAEEKAEGFREIGTAFEDAALMPMLISDMGSAAADSWGKGEDFHGIGMPSLGAAFDPLMLSLMDCLAGSSVEDVKHDISTFTDIIAVFAENNMLGTISKDPMGVFSNESATEKIMFDLLENPRLSVMVDAFSDFGITMLMESVKVPQNTDSMYDNLIYRLNGAYAENENDYVAIYSDIFDDYGLRVSKEQLSAAAQHRLGGGEIVAWVEENVVADEEDFLKKTERMTVEKITEGTPEITDKQAEAKALANSYKVIGGLMGGMNKSGFEVKNMLRDLGPVLDAFSNTQSIGPEKTEYILKALLQSEMVHDKIGLSVIEATDSAHSICENSATKGYGSMLNSLALAVDVVSAASSADKNTQEAVNAMLEDLTPESAKVLQTITTPSVVGKYGVPQSSSEPISDMISDTFGNLSTAKEEGMTDEEYAKESAAVSDMMNVLMSTGKGGKMFGEDGRTGTSADQFVNNIMDSSVMSSTMVDTVYKDGATEPTLDPLSSNRQMAQEEKDALVNSLNNRWNESDKSEESRKEILSVAAIMNVTVEINEYGVAQIFPEENN